MDLFEQVFDSLFHFSEFSHFQHEWIPKLRAYTRNISKLTFPIKC